MDVVVGVAQWDQPVAGSHLVGHVVGDMVFGQRPRIADDLVHALGAEHVRKFLGRGIDALHAAFGFARERLFHGLQLGVRHRQFAAVERRPSENEVFASHFDPFFDPFDTLEPDQFGRPRGVGDIGREAAFAARAGIGYARHAGAELEQGGRIVGDLGDAVDFRAVDIAEREMVKQIAHGRYAQLLVEQFGPCLADAGDVFHVVRIPVSHRGVTIR